MFTQDKCLINVTLHSFYHTILPSPFVSGDKSYDIARLYLLHHYLQYMLDIFPYLHSIIMKCTREQAKYMNLYITMYDCNTYSNKMRN